MCVQLFRIASVVVGPVQRLDSADVSGAQGCAVASRGAVRPGARGVAGAEASRRKETHC